MRYLTNNADLILASLVGLQQPHDEVSEVAVRRAIVQFWHEVDELLVRGFVERRPDGLAITKAGWEYANEQMAAVKKVEEYSCFEPGCAGFKMRLVFEFDIRDCERTIVVPAHISFEEFHTIIQATMNWMNYHLYDFTLEDKDGKLLVLTHVEPTPHAVDAMWQMFSMGDEEEEEERVDAAGVYLDSIFPDVMRAVYNYDYGDGWCIFIDCLGEATLEDGFPTCLDGTGDAPPEDVGGEWGFQEFLDILNDPSDPDRPHMVEWGLSQGYMPFDLADVVSRLRTWRNFTANDAKSYALAPGSQSANNPQPLSEEEAAARSEAAKANRVACSKYLGTFEKSLRASRVSEKTVQKHLDGMQLFLFDFLNDGDVATMEESPALIDWFMGDWVPRNGWATKTTLKGYATSLKKFYKCMLDEGLVPYIAYRYVLDEIKLHMDEWLEPFDGSYGYWVKTN